MSNRISDVNMTRILLHPVATCHGVQGSPCTWKHYVPLHARDIRELQAQSKRHAFRHHGHYVVIEQIIRTSYQLSTMARGQL
jgi:hypothetical protein